MKIINYTPAQNIKSSHREREEKNVCHGYKAITIVDGKCRELVDLRIGQTNAAAYACVWCLDDENKFGCGSGQATGYGYHRASAAAEAAFRAAGVTFDSGFSGMGDSAIRDAVQTMGDYLAHGEPVYVVEFYG